MQRARSAHFIVALREISLTVYSIRLTTFLSVAANCTQLRALRASVAIFIVVFPLSAHAQIVISEIFYDAPGTDTKQEWIELYNSGSTGIDLTKWKIHDGAGHVLNVPPKNGGVGELRLAPSQYLILASDAATFRTAHTAVNGSIIDTTLSLNNDSESISLLNASGTIVASVGYSGSDGAGGDGNSLQRSNGGWVAALPTPGVMNASASAPGPQAKKPAPPKAPKPAKATLKTPVRAVVSKNSVPVESVPEEAVVSKEPEERLIVEAVTTSSVQTASVLPVQSVWLWGLGILTLLVSIGTVAARHVAKDEWEIEEVSAAKE